jgi:DNA-binding transcriptional LysR family regulator
MISRWFVQVVRSGSFSDAARCLRMPANTLSRRIDQLEGQLGTRLRYLSTRKLAPGTEGQALFERYAPALDQILEIGRLHADEQAPSGSVRVTAMRPATEAGLKCFGRRDREIRRWSLNDRTRAAASRYGSNAAQPARTGSGASPDER